MTLTMSAAYVCTCVQCIIHETEILAIARWIDLLRLHIPRLRPGPGMLDSFFQ
jgi:hypothetical protein